MTSFFLPKMSKPFQRRGQLLKDIFWSNLEKRQNENGGVAPFFSLSPLAHLTLYPQLYFLLIMEAAK